MFYIDSKERLQPADLQRIPLMAPYAAVTRQVQNFEVRAKAVRPKRAPRGTRRAPAPAVHRRKAAARVDRSNAKAAVGPSK